MLMVIPTILSLVKDRGTDTTYYMDMELMPGLYRFYLIANENRSLTPG